MKIVVSFVSSQAISFKFSVPQVPQDRKKDLIAIIFKNDFTLLLTA